MKLPSVMLATVAWTGIATADLSSQVIISEVDFSATDHWIELHNQSPSDFDLSNFSIYHATKTPFRMNDYWYGIPMGTVIKGKNYLRIFWGVEVPLNPPGDPRNMFTGNSPWNFLFGHGFEKLDASQGAIGLCKTKLNSQMNNAGIFTDWIQWGGINFKRGQTAVNSRLWESNTTTILAPSTSQSVIVIYDERNRVTPPAMTAYAHDDSPTPLGHNAFPLERKSLGGACNSAAPGNFLLTGEGFPFYGNPDFKLSVSGTQGPAFFEAMMLLFSFDSATARTPMGICDSLDLNKLLYYTTPFATTAGSTTLSTPLSGPASLKTATVYVQGAVMTMFYFGVTDVLKLQFSN